MKPLLTEKNGFGCRATLSFKHCIYGCSDSKPYSSLSLLADVTATRKMIFWHWREREQIARILNGGPISAAKIVLWSHKGTWSFTCGDEWVFLEISLPWSSRKLTSLGWANETPSPLLSEPSTKWVTDQKSEGITGNPKWPECRPASDEFPGLVIKVKTTSTRATYLAM